MFSSSPVDFHQEMSRFRRQLNHIFSDFDHSFAMHNDPFFGVVWNDPVPYDRPSVEEQTRPAEQKGSGEQKYSGPGTGDSSAISNQMAAEATPNPTVSVTNNAATMNGNSTAPGSAGANVALQSSGTQPVSVARPWGWLTGATRGSLLPSSNCISVPRVDLVEKDDHFLLNCDLPGVSKENVKVAVTPSGVLSINAEHSEKSEQNDDKAKYHRVERSYGKYCRSLQLPASVDADAVKAKHENGLLQLTLPKKPNTETKATVNVPIH